jgi:hypothetical protein
MNFQSWLKVYNRSYQPNTLRQEDLLGSSGEGNNLLEGVYYNVVIVLEGNRHELVNNKDAGLLLLKANRF